MKRCVLFKYSILGAGHELWSKVANNVYCNPFLLTWVHRARDACRVSVMSDHELLLECWWAVRWQKPCSWQRPRPLWFVLAAAYRVATWLPLPPISLGYTECIHSRSVIEFHTCHSRLNSVFCEVCVPWKNLSWYAWEFIVMRESTLWLPCALWIAIAFINRLQCRWHHGRKKS